MPLNSRILLKGSFNLKLLNNPFASCFLLSRAAHFNKSIILPVLSL